MNTEHRFTTEELSRYSRHITLEGVGLSGQKRLKEAAVLIVGSGGLGSPVIQYLATAGIGTLGIVDNDVVDLTNLQRQIIHNIDYIGKSKTESAKRWVDSVNPNCKVNQYNELLSKENVEAICNDYDVIIDCTDNFDARYILNDATVKQNKPYIYGSILGFEGQVGVFNFKMNSPSYRDLVPSPPPAGLMPSCVENGVLGVLPGIIGTLQATEAIKIILEKGSILDGKILTYNALKMDFRTLSVCRDEGNQKLNIEKKSEQRTSIDKSCLISTISLQSMIDNQEDIILVDVRKPAERDICRLERSINYPSQIVLQDQDIFNELLNIESEKTMILYCKSGFRSEKCLAKIRKYRRNTFSLDGGILAWIEDIDHKMAKY